MDDDRSRKRGRTELRRFDWDAIAGIIAAGLALVLHLLHIVETEVLLTISLVVLALLLFRDLRREAQDERLVEQLDHNAAVIESIAQGLRQPDVVLLGPRQLRPASVAFAQGAHGEMVWFNVCLLMFKPQALFDALLAPALDSPRVTGVQFVLDESERQRWFDEVVAKATAAGNAHKLREPRWVPLKHEAVSFILADTAGGETEAHLSFWGEPFMARQPGFDIPRYVFHIQTHSPLIPQLIEVERRTRGSV